jgi:hypothetical protein
VRRFRTAKTMKKLMMNFSDASLTRAEMKMVKGGVSCEITVSYFNSITSKNSDKVTLYEGDLSCSSNDLQQCKQYAANMCSTYAFEYGMSCQSNCS